MRNSFLKVLEDFPSFCEKKIEINALIWHKILKRNIMHYFLIKNWIFQIYWAFYSVLFSGVFKIRVSTDKVYFERNIEALC